MLREAPLVDLADVQPLLRKRVLPHRRKILLCEMGFGVLDPLVGDALAAAGDDRVDGKRRKSPGECLPPSWRQGSCRMSNGAS